MYRFIVLLVIFFSGFIKAEEETSVLIIGNSYTFYNDLPELIQAIADADGHPMKVDSYTAGAMSLRGFLNSPQHTAAAQKLAMGHYDWLILQEQSQMPSSNPEETIASVRRWSELARAQRTRTMLFLTWAHAAVENGRMTLQTAMQNDTSLTYCRAAAETNSRVAPVGEAWRRWYRKYPTRPLHQNDLSHPTPEGTYLAACVIYSSLTGRQATSIPVRLRNSPVRISAPRARDLQKIAAQTLRGFSPARYISQREEQDKALPSADDVRAMLTRHMTISQLTEKIGRPHLTQRNDNQVTYQFRLRGQAELVAYCNTRGKIQQISIQSPTSGVIIIDLAELEE
ncbi:MAG: hypothetical protein IKJ58_04165 [Akkermansia sp.]|nr:hypothetical protein [Akkermansia sp.]